ncbi:MAG: SAM-dependent methyltransferase [Chloroflexi bacterium GWB2_49_20]|nr:MAG: SAM-dependent methyltransferase [Chloroflexi bacterium GWB2_49_20]OGN76123.1 MAG: SAM-dependent methyltransferase [Chloroflexi bacterium GWC2_49_37]OGN83509.1 MAG: SAM-dependent methyltransferase [Chloroflexi bacterium GWD2_49_16]HBG73910.1 SAM-dependent methyltransferase [Anaerolineae bacterium]HCC79510.1 SAM-dependent methyltransferase [Anaerolineae bacterium]
MTTQITLLTADNWMDYELLDSGDGQKLERFGKYVFVRPEVQAIWKKHLPLEHWQAAHAVFQPSGEESGGHWLFNLKVPERWLMNYANIKFWAQTTPGRHLGVFPEGAAHWDWMSGLIKSSSKPVHVLNLFGYTGLATLAAAEAGATVTHVDASKKAITWARENQILSGLQERPIRWIVDDALKFVLREARRGVKYHGLIVDPPKFGRGPKGEIWEVYKSLPVLLDACRLLLDQKPVFAVLTVYAVKASSVHVRTVLEEMLGDFSGSFDSGELVTRESNANRLLSSAVYARWDNKKSR